MIWLEAEDIGQMRTRKEICRRALLSAFLCLALTGCAPKELTNITYLGELQEEAGRMLSGISDASEAVTEITGDDEIFLADETGETGMTGEPEETALQTEEMQAAEQETQIGENGIQAPGTEKPASATTIPASAQKPPASAPTTPNPAQKPPAPAPGTPPPASETPASGQTVSDAAPPASVPKTSSALPEANPLPGSSSETAAPDRKNGLVSEIKNLIGNFEMDADADVETLTVLKEELAKIPSNIREAFKNRKKGANIVVLTKNISSSALKRGVAAKLDAGTIGSFSGSAGKTHIFYLADSSRLPLSVDHEFGHYLDYHLCLRSDFVRFLDIYEKEKGCYVSADGSSYNSNYDTSSSMEFFAGVFQNIMKNANTQNTPEATAYVQRIINMCTNSGW